SPPAQFPLPRGGGIQGGGESFQARKWFQSSLRVRGPHPRPLSPEGEGGVRVFGYSALMHRLRCLAVQEGTVLRSPLNKRPRLTSSLSQLGRGLGRGRELSGP